MEKNRKNTTLKDVAEHCGIAKSTVSRALFRPEMVSEAMRERVRAAAQELNYIPNPVARALNFGDINLAAMVVPNSSLYLQSALILGCRGYLEEQGVSMVVLDNLRYEHRTSEYREVLRQLICNGIIFCFENEDRFLLEMAPILPVVSFECRAKNREFSSVETDIDGIVALGWKHLEKKGRRRIGFALGRQGDIMTRRYEQAIARECRARGLEPEEALVCREGWSYESGYRAVKKLLALPQPPGAIFCIHGNMGQGALCAARELGRRVPEDLGILCGSGPSDNRYVRFPLDMVVQPIARAGEALGRMLLAQMRGEAAPGEHQLFAPEGVMEAGSV